MSDKNKTQPLLIWALILLGVICAYLLYRLEKKDSQFRQIIYKNAQTKGERQRDPYKSGPVKNTIRKRAPEIQKCYNDFISRNTPAETDGILELDWQIDDDGSVVSPEIISSQIGDGIFKSCTLRRVATWRFPEPPFDRKVYISHKFSFKKVAEKAK